MPDRASFRIPADHPCFPGHFPGRPVVPGVVLLDETVGLLLAGRVDWRVTGLEAAKFLAPVLPGQEVGVEWDEAAGRVTFVCAVAGRPVLRGKLRIAPATGDAP